MSVEVHVIRTGESAVNAPAVPGGRGVPAASRVVVVASVQEVKTPHSGRGGCDAARDRVFTPNVFHYLVFWFPGLQTFVP